MPNISIILQFGLLSSVLYVYLCSCNVVFWVQSAYLNSITTVYFNNFIFCTAWRAAAVQTGREGGSRRRHGYAVFVLACAWVRGAVSHSQEEILCSRFTHNHTHSPKPNKDNSLERERREICPVSGRLWICEWGEGNGHTQRLHTSVYRPNNFTWWQYFTSLTVELFRHDKVAFKLCSTTTAFVVELIISLVFILWTVMLSITC